MNTTLNPKIFDDQKKMKEKVRSALLDVAEEFLSKISEEIDIPILDILLVGSNANYNYTEKSDVDVHIVTDFEQICNNISVTTEMFTSLIALFKRDYSIMLKGIRVEVYVEDINSSTRSGGVYSILRNEWVIEPSPDVDAKELDPDSELLASMIEQGKEALTSNNSSVVQDYLNQIYLLRKYSLMKDGEFGEGNLVFKEIRNNGLLDELKKSLLDFKSRELSLERLRRRRIK